MPQAKTPPRRERRVNFMADDHKVYQAYSLYVFLTVDMLTEITGRPRDSVLRRCSALAQAGILGRQRLGVSHHMYFFDKKGGHLAAGNGYLDKPMFVTSKSPTHIDHDLEATRFHMALRKALGDPYLPEKTDVTKILEWDQWRSDLMDLKELSDEIELIPDARFRLVFERPSLLENVKSYESGYDNHESSLVSKLREYIRMDIERVLVTMPTVNRVEKFLQRIAPHLPSSKIWVTYEDAYRKDILGKIWWTPKNFESRQYSILKPES
jgi:hypothetical protein